MHAQTVALLCISVLCGILHCLIALLVDAVQLRAYNIARWHSVRLSICLPMRLATSLRQVNCHHVMLSAYALVCILFAGQPCFDSLQCVLWPDHPLGIDQ